MTEEESQISYLTFHFKILEKLEQTDQSKQKEENNKNYWEKLVGWRNEQCGKSPLKLQIMSVKRSTKLRNLSSGRGFLSQ